MKKISRVGLVGFGAVAESAHLECLRAVGVEVAAVADVVPARRQAAAHRLPGARIFESHSALLSSGVGIDALIVTTPPSFHSAAVLDGLRAGVHVLCEKPLTLDESAFSAIRAEAAERDLCVYSVNNWAYAPQWSRLLETAASGALGALRHVAIRVLRTSPSTSVLPGDWRKDPAVAGGGIFVDHGWHNLYLLRRLLGRETRLISAVLSPHSSADEVATALFSAPGAAGTLHLSWKSSERSNTAFISGEKGIAELLDDRLVVRSGGTEETTVFPEKLSAGSSHPAWLAAMWPEFEAECAGRGRGANLDEAAFCLSAIRSAYQGLETSHV